MNDVVVDAVLDVGCAVLDTKELRSICLILGEQKFRFPFAKEPARPVRLMLDCNYSTPRFAIFVRNAEPVDCAQNGAIIVSAPRPCVAEPYGRKNGQVGFAWPSVRHGELDSDAFGACFGVFGGDIKIPVFVKDAGVEQLILEICSAPAWVFFHELAVRELSLRVL